MDFARQLLLFDFSFSDFDGGFGVDVRLRQTAKRPNYLSDHLEFPVDKKRYVCQSVKGEEKI